MRAFPAWVTADGTPRSWAHYRVGLRHLAAEAHRGELRRFYPAWMVEVTDAERRGRWLAQMTAAARWPA